MLTITQAAAQAIQTIVASIGDVQGVRLEPGPVVSSNGHGPTAVVAVSAVSEPEDLDQVIQEHGAQVFVDAPLAGYLDDKVLDIDVEQGEAAFTLSEQE